MMLSWHVPSNFCVSPFLTGHCQRPQVYHWRSHKNRHLPRGSWWVILPGQMHSCLHPMSSSRNIFTHWGDIVPPELVGAVKVEVSHAHLACSHLFDSTFSSVRGTILVQWDSRSGKDLRVRELWAQGSLLSTSTSKLQQSALVRQGYTSWGDTGCILDFKRASITSSLGPKPPFLLLKGRKWGVFYLFSIHRWLLAISSHSFSHTEWKNTSKSGATGSKFWARLCWNISLPGKINTSRKMAQHEHISVIIFHGLFCSGVASYCRGGVEKTWIAELTLFMFWETT